MDSAIWREFPAELQERVLALLPLPLLFRCRVVCKSWNALVPTPEFCTQIPHKQSYVLVAPTFDIEELLPSRGGGYLYWRVYDVTAERWYKLPQLDCLYYGWNCIRTIGAAGGLICVLRTLDDCNGSLVVCNPIAKTINNDLPLCMCTARGHGVGDEVVMAFHDVTNSYKIFVIHSLYLAEDAGMDRFHVYESITQRWRSLAKVPKRSVVISSIFFQGILYTLFEVGAGSRHTLLAYDIQENSWMETGVRIPESVQIPQLVVTNGGLYLFGGFNNQMDPVETVQSWYPKILQIWEVQFSSKRCVEIEKMPSKIIRGILGEHCDLYQRRNYYSIYSVTAVGFGTSILITSCKGVPTIFELSNHKWRLVPQLPQPADSLDHGLGERPLFPQGQALSANLINLNLGARV